jgi:hypothetical protein
MASQQTATRRRRFSMGGYLSVWRCVLCTLTAVAMIGGGVYLYELWYWHMDQYHPIIFISGGSLIAGGVIWLAADWFDL